MEFSKLNKRDAKKVTQLFTNSFTESEGRAQGDLVGQLAKELIEKTAAIDFYGFTATKDTEIVGCILFTRLAIEGSTIEAFLLSPVAIETSHQSKGIGQYLIRFGINTLRSDGAELLVTYGDPKYYSKTGFTTITESVLKAPLKLSQPHGWQAQSLIGDNIEPIAGNSYCVEAFNKPELW